jgi:hypothetical protein
MEKKKNRKPVIAIPEKHPLQEIPVDLESTISEEDLDAITNDEAEDAPPYEPPVEGEGP